MKPTAEITPLKKGNVKVHAFSRFFGQPLYLGDRDRFWGVWEPVDIPPSPSDQYITVDEAIAGRIDLISYRYYRTPELWWVIAEANALFFPPEDLIIGMILRIPSITTLTSLGLMR